MGNAFKDDQPALVLADLTTQTGKDIQAGYRFLFMGTQQAIRNPAAHEQFGEIDDDEAFELLGLGSHLMRELDQVSLRSLATHSPNSSVTSLCEVPITPAATAGLKTASVVTWICLFRSSRPVCSMSWV